MAALCQILKWRGSTRHTYFLYPIFPFVCVLIPHADLSQSYYIGDAAGRPGGWKAGMKRDFSCSDRCVGTSFFTHSMIYGQIVRAFASNIGLKFQVYDL